MRRTAGLGLIFASGFFALWTVGPFSAAAAEQATDFRLDSPELAPNTTVAGRFVYQGYGCRGLNLSPALNWSNPPEGTRSFVVTVFDPDAKGGAGWWHWVVYNLPATTRGLPEGAGSKPAKLLPAGAREGKTDFGESAYGGPCPPPGDPPHHYVFTIYALASDHIELSGTGFTPDQGVLARSSFTVRYGRPAQ